MTGSLHEKHGKYYVVTRVPNEKGEMVQKWISTGVPCEKGRKREAQQKMQEILTELERDSGAVPNDILFGDLAEQWFDGEKFSGIRQVTLEAYRIYLDKHIKPYFGDRKLKEITKNDIDAFYKKLVSDGLSPNSIPKIKIPLNGTLRLALDRKLIRENPVDNVKLPKRKKYIAKVYSLSQAKQLFSAMENETLKPAVVLALHYGLRRSEICGLRWQDVDLEAGTILICNTVVAVSSTIEQEQTKTSASLRKIPLLDDDVTYLRKLKAEQEEWKKNAKYTYDDPEQHVCIHQNGKPFQPGYISKRFREIIEKNDLPEITLHGLRHTVTSFMFESGINPKEIQEMIGHDDLTTTMNTYTHLTAANKKDTAEKLSSIFRTDSIC